MNCDSQTEQKFQLWKSTRLFPWQFHNRQRNPLEFKVFAKYKSRQIQSTTSAEIWYFVMSARCMDFKVFLTGFKEKTEKHQKQYFTKQAKRELKMKSPVASVATFDEMKFDSRYLIDLWLSWRAQYNKQWVSKGHPCLVLGFNWTSGNNDMVEL